MNELAWLAAVRHGQSEANVVVPAAEARGAEMVDLGMSDAEVPLTAIGRDQATAIGRWLAALPASERPDAVVSSPYRRAEETAEVAVATADAAGAGGLPLLLDERLRDRELGVLEGLTTRGVAVRMPEEATRRHRLGRFYYRPPGGESRADVALRVRAALGDLRREYPDGRVLIFAHDVVILLLRYLLEGLTVSRLVEMAASATLANGSLTVWRRNGKALDLFCCNETDHLLD
jgi:broad specificity phosphatase PhoE